MKIKENKNSFWEKVKKKQEERTKKLLERKKKKTEEKINDTNNKKDNEEPIETQGPQIEEKKPKGLTSQVEELNKKLQLVSGNKKENQNKPFALPGNVKRQLKKLALKNKVLVIMLRRNRNMQPMITDIRNGFIFIDGTPYNCSMDFVFLWKGKYPAIVVKEWDLSPVGTQDYYEALAEGRTAEPIATVIRMLENKETLTKKTVDVKWWIFGGLAIVAGLYVLMGNS